MKFLTFDAFCGALSIDPIGFGASPVELVTWILLKISPWTSIIGATHAPKIIEINLRMLDKQMFNALMNGVIIQTSKNEIMAKAQPQYKARGKPQKNVINL